MKQHFAAHLFHIGKVVQTVQGSQESGFSTIGRTKQDGNGVLLNFEVDVAKAFVIVRVADG